VTPTAALLAGLLGFVLVTAAVTALTRRLLTAVVAFAAYSLGLAMVWLVFRAPDVALTEAAVGAGVTTALFVLLVARGRGDGGPETASAANHSLRARPRSVAVAVLVTLGILATVPSLPAVGAAEAPAFGPVAEFYLDDAADRGVDNVVTAVLVVYRGFDTFGEIGVVFAAAVAALAVLGREAVA
jgi:multicomponent Na+:H+ antiporter subunit B